MFLYVNIYGLENYFFNFHEKLIGLEERKKFFPINAIVYYNMVESDMINNSLNLKKKIYFLSKYVSVKSGMIFKIPC